jgi:hypothetical protein
MRMPANMHTPLKWCQSTYRIAAPNDFLVPLNKIRKKGAHDIISRQKNRVNRSPEKTAQSELPT